jgi:hypothetical protein
MDIERLHHNPRMINYWLKLLLLRPLVNNIAASQLPNRYLRELFLSIDYLKNAKNSLYHGSVHKSSIKNG